MKQIEQIIDLLKLQPHPEGGYFRETYRSTGEIAGENLKGYEGKRNFATSIYFLLTSDSFSAFHKVIQDETWHFYEGNALKIHMISPQGEYSSVIVGKNLKDGEVFQFTVPGGYWFAAEVIAPNTYALVGCTVAPGFDFRDFTLAKQSELIEKFPKYDSLIKRLTR